MEVPDIQIHPEQEDEQEEEQEQEVESHVEGQQGILKQQAYPEEPRLFLDEAQQSEIVQSKLQSEQDQFEEGLGDLPTGQRVKPTKLKPAPTKRNEVEAQVKQVVRCYQPGRPEIQSKFQVLCKGRLFQIQRPVQGLTQQYADKKIESLNQLAGSLQRLGVFVPKYPQHSLFLCSSFATAWLNEVHHTVASSKSKRGEQFFKRWLNEPATAQQQSLILSKGLNLIASLFKEQSAYHAQKLKLQVWRQFLYNLTESARRVKEACRSLGMLLAGLELTRFDTEDYLVRASSSRGFQLALELVGLLQGKIACAETGAQLAEKGRLEEAAGGSLSAFRLQLRKQLQEMEPKMNRLLVELSGQ